MKEEELLEELNLQLKLEIERNEEFLRKKIMKFIIDILTIEEFQDIIENDNIYNFIYYKNITSDMKFNHDYYNKWKLKNKIDSF